MQALGFEKEEEGLLFKKSWPDDGANASWKIMGLPTLLQFVVCVPQMCVLNFISIHTIVDMFHSFPNFK